MNKNHYCVIMAGGIGARFWPMSRTKRPKQFIDILGTGETLIQQTFNRFKKICPPENIFIVTNEIYNDLFSMMLPGKSNGCCETTPTCFLKCEKSISLKSTPSAVIVPDCGA